MGSMHHCFLSHGQSAVERGFKANKEFVVENQFEDSLKPLHIINDYVTSKNVQARTITIAPDMIKSVKAARQRYKIYQNESRKVKLPLTKISNEKLSLKKLKRFV